MTEIKRLASELPFIDQAIRVLNRPNLSPREISSQSLFKVEWACLCGQVFNRRMDHATSYGVRCRTCSRSGKSRLESEVASLLEASLPGFTIKNNYNKATFSKEVDIYIEDLDFAIELDPYHSHFKKEEADLRLLNQLSLHYKEVLRVRSSKLPLISNSSVIAPSKKEMNPIDWVNAILDDKRLKFYRKILTSSEIEAAIAVGNQIWDKNKLSIKNPASSNPEAEKAFIKNISRPGRVLAYTPSGSNDTCLWQCQECPNSYELVLQRFIKGTRCPKHFGKKLREISMKNDKFSKLVDTHPSIYKQLIKILEYPDFPLEQVNTHLRQKCLWRCACRYEWVSMPYVRVKQPVVGCKSCKWGTSNPIDN